MDFIAFCFRSQLIYCRLRLIDLLQILPALNLSTNDSLFTTMMKRLNLSSEESQHSFASPKKRGKRQCFHAATDSEEEAREWDNGPVPAPVFSRKYNGFKRKGNATDAHFTDAASRVVKASVGVQTSLDSLTCSSQVLTEDKSCQVSTPLLRRSISNQRFSSSSPSGSATSLSGSDKIRETSFIALRNTRNAKAKCARSLSPLYKSLKKPAAANHKKQPKKRCSSENEKINCVLKLEDLH